MFLIKLYCDYQFEDSRLWQTSHLNYHRRIIYRNYFTHSQVFMPYKNSEVYLHRNFRIRQKIYKFGNAQTENFRIQIKNHSSGSFNCFVPVFHTKKRHYGAPDCRQRSNFKMRGWTFSMHKMKLNVEIPMIRAANMI